MNKMEFEMDKGILYKKIYEMWPREINFSRDVAQHDTDYSIVFRSLIEQYETVKSKVDVETDHWESIGIWSFHQAITEKAREQAKGGGYVVEKDSVKLADFDKMLRENLEDSSWAEERKIYLSCNG